MNHETIKEYVKGFMNHPGHHYSHVLRVYNLARRIAEKMGDKVDTEVLYTAVLLHDIARSYEKKHNKKYGKDQMNKMVCHAEMGAEWAREYLESIGFPEHKTRKVSYTIRVHRYSTGITPRTIEGRILQECDLLDATGAIGIIRTTVHNVNKPAYHPTIPLPCNPRNLEEQYREIDDWKYGVDHFFFKILRIRESISIPEIKKVAEQRHAYMVLFLEQLEKEVKKNNCVGPANDLLNTMMSFHDLELYNVEQPFKKDTNTLIGRILLLKNDDFINQLKKEVL